MGLAAKKPTEIVKRLKLFLYGGPGTGKTTAAIGFPRSYIIDAERGADHYSRGIGKSDSVLLQTNNADEVIQELRLLGVEKHDYRTVVIDPITTLEADLIERAEKEFGAGDMRIWGKRDKTMRRLVNLLMNLDMNVIITSHAKPEYGPNMSKLGTTHDSWKRLPYVFDLVIELEKRASRRVGIVRKTRLDAFPDGAEFDFSYEEIANRYGIAEVERGAVPVVVASPEKVSRINELIKVLNVEETTVEVWLRKANVETLEDIPDSFADKVMKLMLEKIRKLENGKEAA